MQLIHLLNSKTLMRLNPVADHLVMRVAVPLVVELAAEAVLVARCLEVVTVTWVTQEEVRILAA
jgi:hypothetical protein